MIAIASDDAEIHEVLRRRKAGRHAFPQLRRGEPLVVVFGRKSYGGMFRNVRLHDRLSAPSASAPPANLRDQREAAFRGAKVGDVQTEIGRDHAASVTVG